MLNICNHPLIEHNLNLMRNEQMKPSEFREKLRFIAQCLIYEASRDLERVQCEVTTPLETFKGKMIADPSPLFVSILRAGNVFLEGALSVFPEAKVGFLGMYRDEETLHPVSYYQNIPKDCTQKIVFLLDPMLATGGSAVDAIQYLKNIGVRDIRMISLVAAPEGIAAIRDLDDQLPIYVAGLDRELNEKGYILPGLGDAGDRIFNSHSA